MTDGFLGVPWPAWGGVCLAVAAIYTVVWPRPEQPASTHPSWRHPILRWAHAQVWLVLAGSCFLRAADWPGSADGANALALLAALLYAIFLATLVIDRKLRC
jgi:drug/metabolite transporter (DMT)-like permease